MTQHDSDNTQFSNDKNFYYQGEDLELLSEADNFYKTILRNFDKYIGKDVLEVGAGSGNLSRWIRELYPNINLTTLEPSPNMAEISKQKNIPKIDYKVGFLSEHLPEFNGKFDTIIYNNVLEHIEDDVNEMLIANTILKEGGHILTYSPSIPELYSSMDKNIGHFRRYTKKEMEFKMNQSNFVIETSKYHDFLGAFLMFIKFKILKIDKIEKGNANLYFNRILPIVDRVENLVPVPIGKNIFVIGKKK